MTEEERNQELDEEYNLPDGCNPSNWRIAAVICIVIWIVISYLIKK